LREEKHIRDDKSEYSKIAAGHIQSLKIQQKIGGRFRKLCETNRVTIQAFLEGKTIWGKTIKAFRTIVLSLMVLPWFHGF
jgi:hypothetical protein